MGAVRMRVQTADKNITIIHTTPVHQLMSYEVKSWVFVRNKSIIKTCLTSNRCFWTKYESIIYNNASSSVKKVHLLLSAHIKIHQHICLDLFCTVVACKQCLICAYFYPDSDQKTFSLEEALLWIMDLFWS